MYRLVSINNPTSKGNVYVGLASSFRYDGTRFHFGDLHSSIVFKIQRIGSSLLVTTEDSIYTFEKVINE